MANPLLTEFHQKLSHKRATKSHVYDDDIKRSYRDIIDFMSSDYKSYQENVGSFLASLEENNEVAIPFEIDYFWEQSQYVVKHISVVKFDDSVIEGQADLALVDRYFQSITRQLEHHHEIRLSDEVLSFDEFTAAELKALTGLLIDKLQIDSKNLSWDLGMVQDHLNQFSFLRQILKKLNGLELFYQSLGMLLDRFASSEYNQLGRNVSEDILSTSFKDEFPHLGFFSNFRFYSSTGSAHAGLMYANLSLRRVIKDGKAISDKFLVDTLWQAIKFFRNVGLYHWAGQFYKLIPSQIFTDRYHRRAVDHTYFSVLLKDQDENLPSEILDYLNQEREAIIVGGVNDTLPWLLTLLNIRRIYEDADFSATGLGFYLGVFEQIVPVKIYKKHKAIITGSVEELKPILKESLTKLHATRYERDFVYDNEGPLGISSRLIPGSVNDSDAEGFLLAMILKSDYSILFEPEEVTTEVTLSDPEPPEYLKAYEKVGEISQAVGLNNGEAIIWIAVSEGDVYQLTLFNGEYMFDKLAGWSTEKYRELDSSDFFTGMSFSDTGKVNGQIQTFFADDFLNEADGYKKTLENFKIVKPEGANAAYFIMDMRMSRFPHQMLLDQKGEFISQQLPTANVMSLDWLIGQKDKPALDANLTKSIWIPTESQDFALIYLEQFIDRALTDHGFNRYNCIKIAQPLSSDINIVCSHGGSDIAEIQIVSHENTVTADLDHIVGAGKILILFVCHAGSKQNEMFRNNIASLVKRFIRIGYQAVIAPAWALEISVPRDWLPEFMEAFKAGLPLGQCVFRANRKVYDRYSTPAAWANLHLHGNPHLRKKTD